MDTNTKKLIIGFVGPLASGKGTAAAYLKEKYGASVHRFSTMLRDILTRVYLPINRDNLINLSVCLRATFGEDTLARVIAEEAKASAAPVVAVDGIRRPADIVYLSKLPNFHLVALTADSRLRYERLVARGENEGDAQKTFEEFLADQQKPTEVTIAEIAAQAEVNISNDGTKEDLYKQLDELVKRWR